ncbi:MAG: hypothetical protein U5L96_05285 [Owenweeksia sp.]|nr:hypothetical protein [Owenweeksia sp.]
MARKVKNLPGQITELSTSHFWSIYTTDTSDRFSARINFDGDSTRTGL